MDKKPLQIIQVNTQDRQGGASKIALNLLQAYRRLGERTWMVVGKKTVNDPEVIALTRLDAPKGWEGICLGLAAIIKPYIGKIRGAGRLYVYLNQLAMGQDVIGYWQGMEEMHFPATRSLLGLAPPVLPKPFQIVHAHNLHGDYFDLRALQSLSAKVPVILTLHDAWLLSGHCAHAFDCTRWQSGCGNCPDLTIYPALAKDTTHVNWVRKKAIYAHSRLYIATPSQWLMDKVRQSILNPAMIEGRVIPNGVDTQQFVPGDQQAARRELGLDLQAKIILFAANGIKGNPFKDFSTLKEALRLLGEKEDVVLIALGESGPSESYGRARIDYVPHTFSVETIARYYQAANVYVHAALAENFPTTILEAMACGLPVVASRIGGIPEQVIDQKTGLLVDPASPKALATALSQVLGDPTYAKQLGLAGLTRLQNHFTLERQAQAYWQWYEELASS